MESFGEPTGKGSETIVVIDLRQSVTLRWEKEEGLRVEGTSR